MRKKLKESFEPEKYLLKIINSTFDGIAVADELGRFEFGNDSFFNIIGWPREKLIGKFFIEVIPEDMRDFVLKRWDETQTVSEIPYETRIITKNSEIRYLYVSHSRADLDDKRKFIVTVKDISEQKKIELILKESEARYRDLFENADDPMFTLDAQNYFLDLNHAGLKVLGCSKEEVIGTHISKWLTPESFEIAQIGIKKRLLGEPVEPPSILELLRKNGEIRWVEVRSRILRDGGRIEGMHGIARDITEKRRLEQQLKEYHERLEKSYEELKEADRLKIEFISNITHELLTPLTSIRGFAELLNDETVGIINDEQKKSLEIVLRNSDRLTRLIKELLDAAYFEQNKFKLQFGLVSINDILSKSVVDIYPQAKDKQIEIIQDMKTLPEIWADEEKITQVFANLLSNAIKFTPQKGMITVTTAEYTNQIKISIADTGIGIPAEKLTLIFERFYQVDGSTSRKYGGTGLGLSICKSIIEGHFGAIWAESNGKGSIFHVTLPKLLEKKKRSKIRNVKS